METATTPPRTELLRRAAELGPLLRANAQKAEQDTNFELYGRLACGLAPNTQYL